ncbi:hypothetical protein RZS08_44975, partial [Arthrospira platensis SPKY1]|nr:hypothetical protein [Arthrospira platensis SPKY1]
MGAHGAQLKTPIQQARRGRTDQDPSGRGQLLQPRRQVDGCAIKPVVRGQQVADRTDHHLARMDAHAHLGFGPAAVGTGLAHAPLHRQRRQAGAQGMVL